MQVIPWLEGQHVGQVQITMYYVPQPWHPQSATLAEGALAVERVKPDAVKAFIMGIFDHREKFNDDAAFHLSRVDIYKLMVPHAEAAGLGREEFLEGLAQNPPGQGGIPVTTQLKFYVKHHRAAGVHVTPSVLLNGIADNGISSSWSLQQWKEHLTAVAGLTAVEGQGAAAQK
jgi:hypothetical protein